MTTIRVRFNPPTGPVAGQVRFTPRHDKDNRPLVSGQDIITGDTGWIDVPVDGAEIDVRPTEPGWHYVIRGKAEGAPAFNTTVLVPANGPVPFESLVRYDPKAGMAYEPDPEWWTWARGIIELDGIPGKSAYEVAVLNGYTGTESEWLAEIKGEQGEPGPAGGLTPEAEDSINTAVTVATTAADEVENATRVTTRFRPGDEAQFRVLDNTGRFAWGIGSQGETIVGTTKMVEAENGWRVSDKYGAVALEVDDQGRTHIYDLATGGAEQVTELHVFVAAGQSNMQGAGRPLNSELDTTDPRIMQYGATRRQLETATVPLDMNGTASGVSPATVFAREYLRTQPSTVGVLLVPAARGGTRFTEGPAAAGEYTWTKGAADSPEYALYELSVAQTQEAITTAEAAGYTTSLKAVLWHQGEGNGSMTSATYASYLDALIADYRADLSSADLPVVVGQMSLDGMIGGKVNIDLAHLGTPARVTRTSFAPSAPNDTGFYDATHFSRIGVERLGKSYMDAYPRAVLNVPTGQPEPAQNVTALVADDTLYVEWDSAMVRTTSYAVEYQVGTGSWQTVTRAAPMRLSETVTGIPAGTIRVRVTAYEDAVAATPTTPTIAKRA